MMRSNLLVDDAAKLYFLVWVEFPKLSMQLQDSISQLFKEVVPLQRDNV